MLYPQTIGLGCWTLCGKAIRHMLIALWGMWIRSTGSIWIYHPRIAITILPGRSGLDVSRFCTDGADPIMNGQGNELRAIVGTNEGGNAAQDTLF